MPTSVTPTCYVGVWIKHEGKSRWMSDGVFLSAGGADWQQCLRLRPPRRSRGDGGAARHEASSGQRDVSVPGSRQRRRGVLGFLVVALWDARTRWETRGGGRQESFSLQGKLDPNLRRETTERRRDTRPEWSRQELLHCGCLCFCPSLHSLSRMLC